MLPESLPGVDRTGLESDGNVFGLVSTPNASGDMKMAYESIGRRGIVGFDVDDIETGRDGRPTLVPPWRGNDGYWRAVIEDNGVAVLLAEKPLTSIAVDRNDACHYHSCWFPTIHKRDKSQEQYLEGLKMWVVPYADSPFKLGWVRYQSDAPYPRVVSQIPHLAFEVPRIAIWLANYETLIAANTPTTGLTVAFIIWCGVPVELLHIDRAVLPDGI